MSGNDGQVSPQRTRATKLVALTLTGGAALTLMTPALAFAGDADSTGNQSSTDHSQKLTATPGSDPTIGDLGAAESNNGAAVANSGVVGGEAVTIKTGNAKSSGNQSKSKLDQAATSSGTGGGTTVISQHAFILNAGGAYADTGFDFDGDGITTGDATAWGNRSDTTVSQWATVTDAGGGLRVVDQLQAVENLGLAIAETGFNVGDTIDTGTAVAGGNESTSAAEQGAAVTETPTGPAIVDQDGNTLNAGTGIANTGANQSTGDDSTNVPEAE